MCEFQLKLIDWLKIDTLCEHCVGTFNGPRIIRNKCGEKGPTACSPYPRQLDSLTIRRCHYKGSTFALVI